MRPIPFRPREMGDASPSVRGTAAGADTRDHGSVQQGDTQVETLLQCLECSASSDHGRGWKAFIDEDDDLLVYCAACADREFGE
jgi:hypothetical protein